MPADVLSLHGGMRTIQSWGGLGDGPLAELGVTLECLEGRGRWWRMEVWNKGKAVALREITFPILSLALTDDDSVIVPAISGRLHEKPVSKRLQARGDYPSGWLTMQCAGLYGPKGGTYIGVHDPYAGCHAFARESMPSPPSTRAGCHSLQRAGARDLETWGRCPMALG